MSDLHLLHRLPIRLIYARLLTSDINDDNARVSRIKPVVHVSGDQLMI